MGRILEPLAVGLLDEMVDLVLIAPGEHEAGKIPCPPATMVSYRARRWWQPGRLAHQPLVEAAPALDLDLLHAMDASLAPLTMAMAREADCPYLISSFRRDDARRLMRLDERARFVVAVSRPLQTELAARGVMPEGGVALVRPGVFPVRHAACFANVGNAPSILAGGPLDRFEAFEPVLRSFAEIHRRGLGCVFFILGTGRAERRLRRLAEQLKLTDVLTFVSGQADSQLGGVFKSADVYISAVRRSEFDLASLQAMAAGIPVLAPADSGEGFLQDGRTARLFIPGDGADLTEKLLALLDDRAAARALVETALDYLRLHHTASGMVRQLVDLYRQAAK